MKKNYLKPNIGIIKLDEAVALLTTSEDEDAWADSKKNDFTEFEDEDPATGFAPIGGEAIKSLWSD